MNSYYNDMNQQDPDDEYIWGKIFLITSGVALLVLLVVLGQGCVNATRYSPTTISIDKQPDQVIQPNKPAREELTDAEIRDLRLFLQMSNAPSQVQPPPQTESPALTVPPSVDEYKQGPYKKGY